MPDSRTKDRTESAHRAVPLEQCLGGLLTYSTGADVRVRNRAHQAA